MVKLITLTPKCRFKKACAGADIHIGQRTFARYFYRMSDTFFMLQDNVWYSSFINMVMTGRWPVPFIKVQDICPVPCFLDISPCIPYLNLWCYFQHVLSEPSEIQTMTGQKLPLKCSVDYISFSAHADYQQTSQFLRQLKPAHVVSHVTLFNFLSITRRLSLCVSLSHNL